MTYSISASILSADFARLGEECKNVLAAGADRIHFDVMDNHYVPVLTIGPLICRALREYGIHAPIDVHLMTRPVNTLIIDFAKAGASSITFHPDASDNVRESLDLIHQHGCQAGLAINPDYSLDNLKNHHNYYSEIDLLLIMSVNPGFAGQAFIPETLDKIKQAKEILKTIHHPVMLSVDGGVNINTLKIVKDAGADNFVMGSGLFKQDYQDIIKQCRDILHTD